VTDPTERWRRRRQADENARGLARPTPEDLPLTHSQTRGVCRIVANLDDGLYTVTRQAWDSTAWADTAAAAGFAGALARDFRNRPAGQVGRRVVFWIQDAMDGREEILLDVENPDAIETVRDAEAEPNEVSDATALRFAGAAGIETTVSEQTEGEATTTISLPAGGEDTGDVLVWNAGQDCWQVLTIPDWGHYALHVESWTPAFKQPHIYRVSAAATGYSGVAALEIDSDGDSGGPILLTHSGSGTFPERTVQITLSHAALHAAQQNITVRNAAGTGTVTLQFDKYGHFLGTA